MEYFKKINNKKLSVPIKQEKLLNFYGIQLGDKYLGIGYYDVDAGLQKKLLKMLIHPSARKHFQISLMVINHKYIPPHIDDDLKMVINLYIKTANATTYFWKPKTKEIKSIQLEMQTDGRIFKEEDLECVGSFKAEPYDFWMLDVSKIHSVRSETDEYRIAFCFQSKTLSYNDAIKNLDQIIL